MENSKISNSHDPYITAYPMINSRKFSNCPIRCCVTLTSELE